MRIGARIRKLEQRRPPEGWHWELMVSPRPDMTPEDGAAFVAAELAARAMPEDTRVIFFRVVTPEGVRGADRVSLAPKRARARVMGS